MMATAFLGYVLPAERSRKWLLSAQVAFATHSGLVGLITKLRGHPKASDTKL